MGSVDSGQQRDRDRSSAFEYLLCYSSLIAAKPAVPGFAMRAEMAETNVSDPSFRRNGSADWAA
jgi:hypothetical protein